MKQPDYNLEAVVSIFHGVETEISRFIVLFKKLTPGYLQKLGKAIEENDLEEVKKISRQLKPTFQLLNFKSATEHLNFFIQTEQEKIQSGSVEHHYKELQSAVNRVLVDFENYPGKSP